MIGEKMFEESSLRIGYILCFVTAIGFVCSLTYNVGYFWWFEGGFRLLSIGDILTSYSLWVPGLGTLLFGYGLDLFLQRVEQKKKIIKSKKHQALLKSFLVVPHKIIIVLLSGLLISYLLFSFFMRPLFVWFSACYLLLSLSAYLATWRIFAGRTNQFILGMFIFIPIILSLLFTLGMDKAQLDSKLNQPNANLYFINDERPHPAILLRHLEKGLLAKEINQPNYVLFTWDDLSRVEIIARHDYFKGLISTISHNK